MKLLSISLGAIVAAGIVTSTLAIGSRNPAQANISTAKPSAQPMRSQRRAKIVTTKQNNRSSRSNLVAMNNLELAIYQRVNQYRRSRNLPPLVIDPDISAQARAHSQGMASMGNLSHDGFQQRVAAVGRTIAYRNAAENVAYNEGYRQPDMAAIKGWIESPGHHQNMIGKYDLTGIGVVQNNRGAYYFTQIFIRRS